MIRIYYISDLRTFSKYDPNSDYWTKRKKPNSKKSTDSTQSSNSNSDSTYKSRKKAIELGVITSSVGAGLGSYMTKSKAKIYQDLKLKHPELTEQQLIALSKQIHNKRELRNIVIGATVGGIGGYGAVRLIDNKKLNSK